MTNNDTKKELISFIMSLPPQNQIQLWAELMERGIIKEEDMEARV